VARAGCSPGINNSCFFLPLIFGTCGFAGFLFLYFFLYFILYFILYFFLFFSFLAGLTEYFVCIWVGLVKGLAFSGYLSVR